MHYRIPLRSRRPLPYHAADLLDGVYRPSDRDRRSTGDEDYPQLSTPVATVPATTNAVAMTDAIQADLAARDLLPGEHLLDRGYVDAEHLVHSTAQHSTAQCGARD